MKKILYLILTIGTITGSQVFADDTNQIGTASCDAEISIKLKEPTKEIKTNVPVFVAIQVKNLSTNEMLMINIQNDMLWDFIWKIISPSGKEISPKPDPLHEPISGWFPKLKPLESRESNCDLSEICNFNETGTYKVIVKEKAVFFLENTPKEHKACEIISKPLDIIISK